MGMKAARARHIAGEVVHDFFEHDDTTQGAALAFFTLFSLAPILIVVIFVAGLVFGRDVVQVQILREFQGLMGREEALAVQGLLQKTMRPGIRGLAGGLGVFMLVFGATVVLVQLQSSLNLIWGVAPKRGHLLGTLLRKRLLSLALLLGIGFLLLVSLDMSAALTALRSYLEPRLALGVARVLDVGLSFLVTTVLFAMIFRILPDAEIQWRDVALGSAVSSLFFSLGKWAIGAYLGRTQVASAYGAAGSIVIILLWVYYASLLVLAGAEFTRAYSAESRARKAGPSPGARPIASARRPGLFAPPIRRKK